MQYGPSKHERRSIRLKEYDYSQPGLYHVVVRTKNGVSVLGEIVENIMKLSTIGEIAQNCWLEIPQHFKRVTLDVFQVMPNHLHGIIAIRESLVGTRHAVSRKDVQLNVHTSTTFSKISPRQGTLSVIMRTYKAAVTTLCRGHGFSKFAWHPRFYDHVIRDGKDLDRIRRYILDNSANWANDENFPGNIRMDRLHEGEEDWSALD
jgi:REP element-mobilizing transposase RayT